jgi:hypothetical protein
MTSIFFSRKRSGKSQARITTTFDILQRQSDKNKASLLKIN